MAEPGTPPRLGVIGGSGVYEIDGMTEVAALEPNLCAVTPCGSDLRDCSSGRHEDRRVHAELTRRKGNTLGVVTSGCCNDAVGPLSLC